jgi:predicted PurR-regulated permease PerM
VLKLLQSKAFRSAIWILLLFVIIWIGQQISYVFRPIVVLVTTLFLPVLLSGLLYYLINPVVDIISKGRLPRTLAILFVYLIVFGLLTLAVISMGPILSNQLNDFIDNAPELLARLYQEFLRIQETGFLARFEVYDPFANWQDVDYAMIVDNLLHSLAGNIANVAQFIASTTVIVFTTPFILFYMLKEGRRFPETVSQVLAEPYRQESIKMFMEINATLRAYVQGQLLVSLFVAVFVYIGYRIVGLDYALLLALIAAVTNVIPYFGPMLGTIPGLIVGLIQSPWVGLQVLIIILAVQQLESQFISPQVLGRKMAIHPVVIIFVLLTAGSLAGIFGLVLGIPLFAVMRVIAVHVFAFLHRSREQQQT